MSISEKDVVELDPSDPQYNRIKEAASAIHSLFITMGLDFDEGMSAIGMVIAEIIDPKNMEDSLNGMRLLVQRTIDSNIADNKRNLN